MVGRWKKYVARSASESKIMNSEIRKIEVAKSVYIGDIRLSQMNAEMRTKICVLKDQGYSLFVQATKAMDDSDPYIQIRMELP